MKKDKKIRVSFPGNSATEVTGSMTLVEIGEHKILLEAGLTQGGKNTLEDWKENTRRLPFKARDIEYVFVGHAHADHTMLIPRLVADGFHGRIITPPDHAELFNIMGHDSAYIIGRDSSLLSNVYGKSYRPFFCDDDVDVAVGLIDEYGFDEKIRLTDWLSFRFTPSGHLFNAAQIELWATVGNVTKKIGYTSDLGSALPRRLVNRFSPITQCDLLVGESTYARELRPITQKDRRTDLQKLKTIIQQTCIERGGRVLIPVFALDRAQNIAGFIKDAFAGEKFDIPVLVDSPLAAKFFGYFFSKADGADKEFMRDLFAWENLILITEPDASKTWMANDRPCVILSSSGMLTAGRSRRWVAKILPDPNSHILFCGFAVEGSLAHKIKTAKRGAMIRIDKQCVKMRCGLTDLKSFSGHMSRDGLMNYYGNVNAQKIALVHGDFDAKVEFAHDLQENIGGAVKVICVTKGTEIIL